MHEAIHQALQKRKMNHNGIGETVLLDHQNLPAARIVLAAVRTLAHQRPGGCSSPITAVFARRNRTELHGYGGCPGSVFGLGVPIFRHVTVRRHRKRCARYWLVSRRSCSMPTPLRTWRSPKRCPSMFELQHQAERRERLRRASVHGRSPALFVRSAMNGWAFIYASLRRAVTCQDTFMPGAPPAIRNALSRISSAT